MKSTRNQPKLHEEFSPLLLCCGSNLIKKNLRNLLIVCITFANLHANGASNTSTPITPSNTRVLTQNNGDKKDLLHVKESLDRFMQPEIGLAQEIKSGLIKLENVCKAMNNATTIDTLANAQLSKVIFDKTTVAREQLKLTAQKTEQSVQLYRKQFQAGTNQYCSTLPDVLRLTGQCKTYHLESEMLELVEKRAQIYYSDVLERYRSYELAIELESKGCTRRGFTEKLWRAETEHMVPRLERADSIFNELLRYTVRQP